ncbi:GrpB family protein [Streptomyces sp. NBC_00316]|uniref:GrpB family protein n=1 Tax=Streptomyces sp. NBC_00316 TaxID=2975710 RepID=UPI003FA6CCD3
MPLEAIGFVYRAESPERTKRYFREAPGRRRTHVHVRRLGSFSQQFSLLFRDYLRCHSAAIAEYAAVKRRWEAEFHDDSYGTSPRCRNARIRPVCGCPSALRCTASDAAR